MLLPVLVVFSMLVAVPAPLAWSKGGGAGDAPSGGAEVSRDLNIAKKMIRGGNYSQAIPRLLKILGDAPSSREAVEAHYHLGLVYDTIQDLRSAQQQLKQYLDRAPDGEYAEDAKQRLERLGGALEKKFVSPSELDVRIEAARKRAAESPNEVGNQLELADLLWSKASYEESGKVYAGILQRWPGLKDDMVIRQRMYLDTTGAWHALDPDTAIRQAAERDPLVIYNTSSFRSARQEGLAKSFQNTKYNVSGEAMNRSPSALTDVELIVTIYGFGGKVFETKTVRIGKLAPGASRPFSVVFENFDNIENVERFDVKGSFTQ